MGASWMKALNYTFFRINLQILKKYFVGGLAVFGVQIRHKMGDFWQKTVVFGLKTGQKSRFYCY